MGKLQNESRAVLTCTKPTFVDPDWVSFQSSLLLAKCCQLFQWSIQTSVACAGGPSITMSSTDFSFQNLIFWDLLEFSATEIT
jgi:hypothetical protein